MTPPRKITLHVSLTLAIIACIAIISGHFILAAIVGTTSALNLIAGIKFKKY